MITQDVDEVTLLADRALLMSNGSLVRIAESILVDIPRPRKRAEMIDKPTYYKVRNYLVNRSKEWSGKSPQPNELPLTINSAEAADSA